MPKIFQYLSYVVRFYSNDHLPIHVHVSIQDREAKVEFFIHNKDVILFFKRVKGRTPLTEAEAREVGVFLKTYQKKIVEKWEQVFIYHKAVKCEVVRKKLKRSG